MPASGFRFQRLSLSRGFSWVLACGILAVFFCLGCSDESPEMEETQDRVDPTEDSHFVQKLFKTRTPVNPDGAAGFLEALVGLNDFHHDPGASGEYRFPEIVGSGCLLFDFDGDEDLDAYLIQCGKWEVEEGGDRLTNRLYRNTGDDFVDVTEASGLGDAGYGMGAVAGDFDQDGDLDVWVSNFGASALYENQGDGTFVDVTSEAGLNQDLAIRWWATAATWFDYDLDGDLDLYVAHYVNYTHDSNLECGKDTGGIRDYCSPSVYEGLPDALYRNEGKNKEGRWTFKDVSEESRILSAQSQDDLKRGCKGLGVLATDVDGDGWLDIYVANDQVPNFLYMNQGDGTFEEEGFIRGCAFSKDGNAEASMGITSGDIDGDGLLEIYITHLDFETNTMYRNSGEGLFDDVTDEMDLRTPTMGPVGFGTELFDYDNDCDLDIIVANGHVQLHGEQVRGSRHGFEQTPLLLVNDGTGHFTDHSTESGPFFSEKRVGRGLAVGDVDSDGWLDVLLNMHGDHEGRGLSGQAVLLLNVGGKLHPGRPSSAIDISLVGDGKSINRRGIGARVTLTCDGRAQVREVYAGSSFASQSQTALHYGLGESLRNIEVNISWPSKGRPRDTVSGLESGYHYWIEVGGSVLKRVPFR